MPKVGWLIDGLLEHGLLENGLLEKDETWPSGLAEVVRFPRYKPLIP